MNAYYRREIAKALKGEPGRRRYCDCDDQAFALVMDYLLEKTSSSRHRFQTKISEAIRVLKDASCLEADLRAKTRERLRKNHERAKK